MKYGNIYIKRLGDASSDNAIVPTWKDMKEYNTPYTKYSIKESDFRIKTASFTSSSYFDLTQGQYIVLISSKYHENFAGIVLDVEYEEETGLYTYQCQDWSRRYMSKPDLVISKTKKYNVLRSLLSHRFVPFKNPTKKQLSTYKTYYKGLQALGKYNQSYYNGNKYKSNFFNKTVSMIIRNKTEIEAIRSIVYDTLGYYDVWFNNKGILQIEPISKTDWESTGLIIRDGQYSDRKFKFSTTNAITRVTVTGSDATAGSTYYARGLMNFDISTIFGGVGTSISNPNQNTSSAVKSNKSSSSKSKNKYNNPFNNKKKKVWINSDNGSNSMKNSLASALKKAGWTVHTGATDSNAHYRDYWNVSKDYSVYITLYNGFCAGTIREAYSSKIQNELKKKGVQLVPIWDSSSWTNPKGMKPFRYGDFSKYSAKRAWDDNFSSSNPSIKNVGDYLKKNKATYCVSPTASEIMKQFNAGGYFAYKGIKV